jgi:hypothetical protein
MSPAALPIFARFMATMRNRRVEPMPRNSPRDGSAKDCNMLEAGKVYRVTTLVNCEGAWDEESDFWTVMKVEGTRAKLTNEDCESRIVDTASWNFVKAEAVE